MTWSLWTPWRCKGCGGMAPTKFSGRNGRWANPPPRPPSPRRPSTRNLPAPPPPEPICALSLAPTGNDTQDRPVRNPDTILAELHCIILNIDIDAPWTLLLHGTCLKADLASCSDNCCCRWWLPSSGVWRRAVWYTFRLFEGTYCLHPETQKWRQRFRQAGCVTSQAVSTVALWEPPLSLDAAGRFAELSNSQVRSGQLHMGSASELSWNERGKCNLGTVYRPRGIISRSNAPCCG